MTRNHVFCISTAVQLWHSQTGNVVVVMGAKDGNERHIIIANEIKETNVAAETQRAWAMVTLQ